MNAVTVSTSDDSQARLAQLAGIARQLLDRCRGEGATQAEVSCSQEHGLNVNVRMGAVETVESTRDRGIAVTVYFGKRKGSASTADLREDSLAATVAQACAIAKHTEDDAAAGLADPDLMATDLREFDGWHPWSVDADRAIDIALACEQAGRDSDARIENSDGASVGSSESLSVYANSHGFLGGERSTQHTIGCALIAGRGDGMQRDGWYSTAVAADDLEAAAAIGRHAATRAASRLDA
ncbi:MAG TPA: DNA gyrase modulator, partial [Lysobacter sp.]|nr:DNA gyrase modulator [Lysobacter sp.]